MKPADTCFYWDGIGRYQGYVNRLMLLVPPSGSVQNADKNPNLERFRKAVNIYYDVYNNGLCNRGRQFYSIFRFRSSDYRLRDGDFQSNFYHELEDVMDRIVFDAANEQGLTIPPSVLQSNSVVQQV